MLTGLKTASLVCCLKAHGVDLSDLEQPTLQYNQNDNSLDNELFSRINSFIKSNIKFPDIWDATQAMAFRDVLVSANLKEALLKLP